MKSLGVIRDPMIHNSGSNETMHNVLMINGDELVIQRSENVVKRKIGSEFSSVLQRNFIRRLRKETKKREFEDKEKKRLIRKPDQVGPRFPALGPFCYVWSFRGWKVLTAGGGGWRWRVLEALAFDGFGDKCVVGS